MDHNLMLQLVEETNKPDDYSEFSQEELAAMSFMDGLKSSYRKDAFDRAGLGKYDLTNPIIKSLIKKGLIKVGSGGGSSFGSLTLNSTLAKAVMARYYAPPKFKGDLENPQLRFMRKPQAEAATVIRAGYAGHPEVQAALKLLKKLANATEAGLTSAQQKTLALASVILSNLGVDVVQTESLDEGLTDYDWEELDKEQLRALIDVVNKLMMATKDEKQKAILKKAMGQFAKAMATAA
jgi:hypothetical protein